jgi:signal transduction histidine kinase
LVSDLGHELRTPIATVLTHLEILGFDDVGEDVHRQSLHLARREAQRLSRLVNDMLELGRLETVEALPLRPLNLADLTEEVVFQMMSGARERGIELQGAATAGLPLVLGNADRLRQVLLNLLDNALKYSATGASVTVSLQRVQEGVACDVCDTGPGIPPEHLPYVAQRFYRAAPEVVEGSGLGLSLVQEVLRHHGSELTLASPVAGGRGTCAHFVLPAAGDQQGTRT